MRLITVAAVACAVAATGCSPIPRPGSWQTWSQRPPPFVQKLFTSDARHVVGIGAGDDGRIHTFQLDLASQKWRELTPSPPLFAPGNNAVGGGWSADEMANGKVLIAGGLPEQPSAQAWLYDLRVHDWQRAASMPEPRTEHISAVL